MSEEQEIVRNDGNPHRYFHMMLNIADDDLDPYEYRLLGHYLRRAGHGGTIPEGIRETAKKCQISVPTVEKARTRLEKKGYISVKKPTDSEQKQGFATEVTVLDRWAENIARYSPVQNMAQEGVQNLEQGAKGTPVEKVSQGGVQNLAPYKNKDSEKNKEEEHNPSSDDDAPDYRYLNELVIGIKAFDLGSTVNYGIVTKYTQFLIGRVPEKDSRGRKNADFYDLQLAAHPMTEAEIVAFGYWLELEEKKGVSKAETINRLAAAFRDDPEYSNYVRQAEMGLTLNTPIVSLSDEKPDEPAGEKRDRRADVEARLRQVAEAKERA